MRLLLLVALASCDWSLHRMQEQPRCTVHGTTALLPNGACDLEPPPGIVAMEEPAAPPPITRQLLDRGRDRFERICAACHGVAADGSSQVARAMTIRRPPSLVDQTASRLTDERILTVMATGYGLMPSYRAIVAPRDRYAILHFIRAMQRRELAVEELSPALQQEARRWLH
jgi:mono/diheme cytochrome c family protein